MRREHSAVLPRWLAMVCAFALLLGGCVRANDSEEGGDQAADNSDSDGNDSSAAEPLGTSIGTSTDGGADLVFEIMDLNRTPDEHLVLGFTVHNESESSLQFRTALAGTSTSATPNAVTLIDTDHGQRYFPQEFSDGTCYCAEWGDNPQISAGDSLDVWVVYPLPPDDIDMMIVDIPQSPPIPDIPVGEGSDPPTEPEGELAEPKVLDLYSFADDLGDGTSRSESTDETAIMLSTDVLFDTGESALSDDAEDVLEEAAAEIDEASGEQVQVEGHADDTGSDAVNDPLSLERAEAVRERLGELVSRSEVSYETEGHGSADPIADNETEEGREKNRRVTVTFAK